MPTMPPSASGGKVGEDLENKTAGAEDPASTLSTPQELYPSLALALPYGPLCNCSTLEAVPQRTSWVCFSFRESSSRARPSSEH